MIDKNTTSTTGYPERIELDDKNRGVTSKAELAHILRADADFKKVHALLEEAWSLLQNSKYERLIDFHVSIGWTSLVKAKLANTIKDEDYEGTGIYPEYHLAPFLVYGMETGSCMGNGVSVSGA